MAKYAVIKTGGKQYRVEEGDIIDVELLQPKDDNTIEFQDVLLVCSDTEAGKEGTTVGVPVVPNAVVHAEVVGNVRGPKVIAYKFKRRKDSHCKKGHRQDYLRVKITKIAA